MKPFHALKELPDSSSWLDQVPNFRQEIRQSLYRNDPVKYDLGLATAGLGMKCRLECGPIGSQEG
jgi:hypothetical protein